MKNIFLSLIFSLFILSCSSTTQSIKATDLPSYTPAQKSTTELQISGKLLQCQMTDSSYRSFHFGEGKIHSIKSNWGKRNSPGQGLYALQDEMILVYEDKNKITMSYSLGSCEIGYLEEEIYTILRQSLDLTEEKISARNQAHGSSKGSDLSAKELGECKRVARKQLFGNCEVMDVSPNIDKVLAPFRPKEF